LKKSSLIIIAIAILIACIGILSIYSSTYQKTSMPWQDIYKRQILWVLLGIAVFLIVTNSNYRRLWDLTYFLYACMLIFLFLVFSLGIVRLGAQRWLRIAWFNFQPSEFAKLIIVIFLARYFSRKDTSSISLSSR
jgi:rod shape determining protein RodA